jgi:protease I
MKMAVLVADAFQDSEYFLPKVEIEKLGVATEVVSITDNPIEIYSFFARIGLLDVQKTIDKANPQDYVGVLIPGGAQSPAILGQDERVLAFVRALDAAGKLVAPICRGALVPARAGIVAGRHITGFHLESEYPDLAVRPIVEQSGGLWCDDAPVVIDRNLISSRHPDDVPAFATAIRDWINTRARTESR